MVLYVTVTAVAAIASARQKIDADLMKLDIQIRLLEGNCSATDRQASSEDAGSGSGPTAPMVGSCFYSLRLLALI